jgi:hypothetical protein
MFKTRLAMLVLFFGSGLCFAQEQVTITTYYPSPYGVYNSLLARKMAVGDTNGDGQLDSNDAPASDNNLIVKGNVGIGIATPTGAAAPNGATTGNLDVNDVWLRGANGGVGAWATETNRCYGQGGGLYADMVNGQENAHCQWIGQKACSQVANCAVDISDNGVKAVGFYDWCVWTCKTV